MADWGTSTSSFSWAPSTTNSPSYYVTGSGGYSGGFNFNSNVIYQPAIKTEEQLRIDEGWDADANKEEKL